MKKTVYLKILVLAGLALGLAAGVTACSSSDSSGNTKPVVTLKGAAT